MMWLNKVVDELIARYPDGEILVSSGVSPSGTYHLGTLREVLTAEAIMYEVKRRGRSARHIHVVDDLDVFRKVPVNISPDYEQYLGRPLCDIPSPDNSSASYADYFLNDLLAASSDLHLEMEVVRAHEKYRSGYFVEAIEKALDNVDAITGILEQVSGHKIGEEWSPIQVIEDGYLKNRPFVRLNKEDKTLVYKDGAGQERSARYDRGEAKLNWRIDWPARWWLMGVSAEPFGRDHATKGGSYDTGSEIVKQVYGSQPPIPVPYGFINKTGETKKMSKSSGDAVTASGLLKILPSEVVWYFIVRYAPEKQLFFDEAETLIKLVDDFGALLAKPDKNQAEQQLVDICLHGIAQPTISRVPFSHLVASYQASLKDVDKTIEVIARSEYSQIVQEDANIIKSELKFIDEWLTNWAPEDVKFELCDKINFAEFTDSEQKFLHNLGDKIADAPEGADGDWFHKAIYELGTSSGLEPKDLFSTLYKALIGKSSGPRAGYFLSILPREWLIRQLRG